MDAEDTFQLLSTPAIVAAAVTEGALFVYKTELIKNNKVNFYLF